MPGQAETAAGGKEKAQGRPRGTLRRIKYLMQYYRGPAADALRSFLSNLGNLMGPRFAGKAIGIAEEGFRKGVGQVDMDTVVHYALLMLASTWAATC